MINKIKQEKITQRASLKKLPKFIQNTVTVQDLKIEKRKIITLS